MKILIIKKEKTVKIIIKVIKLVIEKLLIILNKVILEQNKQKSSDINIKKV